MNILITAGGTEEPIDEVRMIKNQATGRLGITVARQLLDEHMTVDVIVTPNVDIIPIENEASVYQVRTVRDLMSQMQYLLENKSYDVVIHTMAVSDFQLVGIATEDQIQAVLDENEALRSYQFSQLFMHSMDSKISSQHEGLYLKLEPTPKVIEHIKQWQPNTTLIGFKLLVDASEEELMMAAHRQQELAGSDYVVINNQNDIDSHHHYAKLVSHQSVLASFITKEEIAQGLVKVVKEL